MTRKRGRRGRLIALEGIDGAGKSTLARAIASSLRRRGFSVALRHEPSDRKLGSLAQTVSRDDAWSGAVYFTVDRYIARPALERALSKHDVVVTDRSFYSTLAYQGSALAPRERRRLKELERTAAREPDQVILLEIPSGAALRRLGGRRRDPGPLEERVTLERVARAYRTLAQDPRWVVLDARAPVRVLLREVLARLHLPRPRVRAAGPRRRT
jgi:dTMP kinase